MLLSTRVPTILLLLAFTAMAQIVNNINLLPKTQEHISKVRASAGCVATAAAAAAKQLALRAPVLPLRGTRGSVGSVDSADCPPASRRRRRPRPRPGTAVPTRRARG
jgi:hypothetical protein